MKPDAQPEKMLDPWEQLDSIAEVLAFVSAKCGGADAVRQCLEPVEHLDRETLEKAAAELEAVGLSKVAEIVLAEASRRPSSIEWNPYPSGSIDATAWLQSWHRRNG